ncbi:MAG: 50S ribosomal protein L22 [Patescibacteria group bacterium]
MEVKAKLKFARLSPRKVKLVIDLVRGLDLARAEEQLAVVPKQAALTIQKLLKSAASNATNNHKLNRQDLFIKSITVGQGPVLKRFRPRAFGRAAGIRKPTCHIEITLATKEQTKQGEQSVKVKK